MSWLNSKAASNIESMRHTLDTSQAEMSSLKVPFPANTPHMSVTADTSHVEMCPYVVVAVVGFLIHAVMAVRKSESELNA